MNELISRQNLIEAIKKWQTEAEPEEARVMEDVICLIGDQPPADVPEINVGEITKAQAIEALKTLKTYCNQYLREDGVVADYTRSCGNCPLYDWCFYDRECLTPDDWQIPQERTEE